MIVLLTKAQAFIYTSTRNTLKETDIEFGANRVTALIGPSGCGKSTFLRTLNRMNDLIEGVKVEGNILLDGENVYRQEMDVSACEKGWAWSSKGQPLIPFRFATMWLTDCLFLKRRDGGMRGNRSDLHQAGGSADGGLHHVPVWIDHPFRWQQRTSISIKKDHGNKYLGINNGWFSKNQPLHFFVVNSV